MDFSFALYLCISSDISFSILRMSLFICCLFSFLCCLIPLSISLRPLLIRLKLLLISLKSMINPFCVVLLGFQDGLIRDQFAAYLGRTYGVEAIKALVPFLSLKRDAVLVNSKRTVVLSAPDISIHTLQNVECH